MNEMTGLRVRHATVTGNATRLTRRDTMSTQASERPTPVRDDRTHFLYIAVIVAVLLGIGVGLLFPDAGVALKPLGTGFVSLIKMMISPVIFCTLVLGIGSVRKAASVGKVGGLAIGYFMIMSTVALGAGLELTDKVRKAGQAAAGGGEGTTDFILGIIPKTVFSSLTEGMVLQTVF